ncbi:MAG: hypothetical protein D6719_07875 [Candidatus Dadabacteria bacterium]|nr:MAG: hypothetical protein D6719_07875 [Candidatus Dadabacteria bacterium]
MKRQTVFKICLAVLLLMLPVYLRTLYEAHNYLRSAEKALSSHKTAEAIKDFASAVRWNSPGNYYAKEALTELKEIAFSDQTPRQLRLKALLRLKRGLKASRNFLQPASDNDPIIMKINTEIAGMMNNGKPASIREIPAPSVNFKFQFLAQVCFWLWIVSVAYSAFCGFMADGSIRRAELLRGVGFSLMFFLLWLMSLSFA